MGLGQCQRFHRDGTRCPHLTDHADGWCREPDCAGYTRRTTDSAPESLGSPHGTPTHLRRSSGPPRGGPDFDLERVRLTQRAVDSFRYHHGGSEQEARVQLLAMLEDFLLTSSSRVLPSGLVNLARSGFDLVITADAHVVTGYGTVHRERTWEQVKAGVPSRFGRKRYAATTGPRRHPDAPPPGPPATVEDFFERFDPRTVHLTFRVTNSYADLLRPEAPDEAALETALREALALLRGRAALRRRPEDGLFEVTHDDLVWLVSPDAQSAIGVKRRKQPRR